jgi:tetratricopeptide (TPR) repeat protein
MGLMNSFSKPFNKDSLTTAVRDFLTALESLNWDTTRYAACTFNKYLQENNLTPHRLTLFKGMLKTYPGDADTLLNLAEPLFLGDQPKLAKRALKQVLTLDPGKKEKIDLISQKLFQADLEKLNDSDGDEQSELNILGIESAVIVDSDAACLNAVAEILTGIGVPLVLPFEDGEAAWDWLNSNPSPGLLIHEWRIPKLSGPQFIQRVRTKHPTLQFICLSSLVNQDDLPLLKEMGVASISPKPLDRQKLLNVIVSTIQQDRLPTKIETLENKLRALIRAEKFSEAVELRANYLAIESISPRRKNIIEAEFAYAEGNYIRARDMAADALRENRDSIVLLNLLSKTLMKLGDFNAALRCLDKAQSISPMNIQRLCTISEVHSDMGNSEAANEALNQARQADAGSETVTETAAKIAINEGNIKGASALLGELESINSFISYMNNKAVAHARCGMFDAGIDLYQKVIQSIPENQKELKIVVTYNLGLAFTRMGEYTEALAQMAKIISFGPSKVLAKANSLKMRLITAQKNGTQVKFNSDHDSSGESQQPNRNKTKTEIGAAIGGSQDGKKSVDSEHQSHSHHQSLITAIKTNPGDICLFLIYFNPTPADERVKIMLSQKPKFHFRQAIERNESFGADKMVKSS